MNVSLLPQLISHKWRRVHGWRVCTLFAMEIKTHSFPIIERLWIWCRRHWLICHFQWTALTCHGNVRYRVRSSAHAYLVRHILRRVTFTDDWNGNSSRSWNVSAICRNSIRKTLPLSISRSFAMRRSSWATIARPTCQWCQSTVSIWVKKVMRLPPTVCGTTWWSQQLPKRLAWSIFSRNSNAPANGNRISTRISTARNSEPNKIGFRFRLISIFLFGFLLIDNIIMIIVFQFDLLRYYALILMNLQN